MMTTIPSNVNRHRQTLKEEGMPGSQAFNVSLGNTTAPHIKCEKTESRLQVNHENEIISNKF